MGALAALAGWYAARVHREGLALPFVASWGVVWFAGMTAVTQSPPGTPKLETPRPFDWVPGMPLESGDPLNALGRDADKARAIRVARGADRGVAACRAALNAPVRRAVSVRAAVV